MLYFSLLDCRHIITKKVKIYNCKLQFLLNFIGPANNFPALKHPPICFDNLLLEVEPQRKKWKIPDKILQLFFGSCKV